MTARTATGLSRPMELLAATGFAAMLTLAARLSTLGRLELAPDELITAALNRFTVGDLIHNRLWQAHSPFYFVLVKTVGSDASEFMLRLPSALFDAVAAAILAGALWKSSGRTGAVAIAVLYAFTPLLIVHGQNARPYALMNLFFAMAIAGSAVLARSQRATARALSRRPMARKPRRVLRLAALMTAVGMAGVGYTLVAAWPALLLLQGAVAVRAAGLRRRQFLRRWLAISLVAWIALLPLVLALWPPMARLSKGYWTATMGKTFGQQVAELLDGVFGLSVIHDPSAFLPETMNTLAGVAIAGLAIGAAIRHRKRPATIMAAAVGLGLPLALLAASAVQSVLVPRYLLLSLVCLSILAADGVGLLWRRRWGRIVAIALGAGVVLQGLDTLVADRNYRWSNVGDHFRARGVEPATGFTVAIAPAEMVRRYFKTFAPARSAALTNVRLLPGLIGAALETSPTVWVVAYPAVLRNGDDLPAGAAVCRWQTSVLRVTMIARHEEDIPAGLAGCAAADERIR